MPRPKARRQIDSFPDYWQFRADDSGKNGQEILLSLEEYETIRLIDKEGLTQEACAEKMGVARTTVTAIYAEARRKLADLLVEGKSLHIAGGSYALSGAVNVRASIRTSMSRKGQHTMRIAVCYENGTIFQHFGHTEAFKIYDAEGGRIVREQILKTEGSGHGALAGFLKEAEVDALICGGIGGGAKCALREAGIAFYPGVSGPADEAVQALLGKRLSFNPNTECQHHHGEGHGSCHGHGHGESQGHGHDVGSCHEHGEGHGSCHGQEPPKR